MRKVLLFVLCSMLTSVFAQDILVAILDPVGMTGEVTVMHRSMVRGEMVKAISRQRGYAAFTRTDIDQLMMEQNFQQSGMVDDATRKRLGAMQGVDYVCVTKITKEGNNYYLEANIVNIESGQISNPATQYGELQGGSLANMLAACEKLAAELVGAKSISITSSSNNAEQEYKRGLDYYIGRNGVVKDYATAVKIWKELAEQGHAGAQYSLGECYYYGEGIAQDYDSAVSWYRKAAEQGYADAQYCLGYCYNKGEGVAQDYYSAVSWYRKAAEQGYARAQCNLGECYEKGEGVAQDYYSAVSSYRKAAEQGYDRAQCNLGNCYDKGIGITKNKDEAVKWYQKAAEQGNEKAKECLKNLQSSPSIVYNYLGATQRISHNGSIITANNQIITGNNNKITGDNNKIMGSSNVVTGNNNKIYGDDNIITGNNNKMYGKNNRATGKNNK